MPEANFDDTITDIIRKVSQLMENELTITKFKSTRDPTGHLPEGRFQVWSRVVISFVCKHVFFQFCHLFDDVSNRVLKNEQNKGCHHRHYLLTSTTRAKWKMSACYSINFLLFMLNKVIYWQGSYYYIMFIHVFFFGGKTMRDVHIIEYNRVQVCTLLYIRGKRVSYRSTEHSDNYWLIIIYLIIRRLFIEESTVKITEIHELIEWKVGWL